MAVLAPADHLMQVEIPSESLANPEGSPAQAQDERVGTCSTGLDAFIPVPCRRVECSCVEYVTRCCSSSSYEAANPARTFHNLVRTSSHLTFPVMADGSVS